MKARIKYLFLSTVLLSMLLGVIPMVLAMPPPEFTTQTKSATKKYDAGLGFWVETTLTVTVRWYPGGQKSFSYSMSHRESKPWCASWYTPHCWIKLYEESPGMWTAENFRKIIMWLPLPFIAYMKVCVHFKESDMTFYYSVKYFDNGVQLFSALIQWLGDWNKIY